MTLLNRVGVYRQAAISKEIQKKKKKYCSEAILKVRYNIYTENKTLRNLYPGGKKINKTRNVFFVHIHSMTNHIQLVNIEPLRPEETEILVGNSDYC